MADDKHYVPGDFYRICERTGFKVRAGHTIKEWTGRFVRDISFEERQPQDFVRGVADLQQVPDPRPRQVDTFLGPLGTTLTQAVAAGGQTFHVQSSVRMLIGDFITVMRDDGVQQRMNIATIPNTQTFTTSQKLLWSAAAGNEVIDISAYSSPNIG